MQGRGRGRGSSHRVTASYFPSDNWGKPCRPEIPVRTIELRSMYNFPPPVDIVAESLLSLSRCPRPQHDLPATFACPVGLWRRRGAWSDGVGRFAPGVRAAAGLFRARQLRQAGSPGGGEPPWHPRSSWSRQGPSCSRWLDANCMGTSPVLHARAGLEAMLSPPFTPSQLK